MRLNASLNQIKTLKLRNQSHCVIVHRLTVTKFCINRAARTEQFVQNAINLPVSSVEIGGTLIARTAWNSVSMLLGRVSSSGLALRVKRRSRSFLKAAIT